jgi:hypothetical protein
VASVCRVAVFFGAGFCTSILAYGQTGSGKTFTMSGEEGAQCSGGSGLMARACAHLFHEIARSGADTAVHCSFLEIYNEAIYDLIHWTQEQLPVRFDARKVCMWPDV